MGCHRCGCEGIHACLGEKPSNVSNSELKRLRESIRRLKRTIKENPISFSSPKGKD